MKPLFQHAAIIGLTLVFSSCISVVTVKKTSQYPNAKGRRVYIPDTYLIGKPAKDGTIVFTRFHHRDETKEYAVDAFTLFGKQTLNIDYEADIPGVASKMDIKQSTDDVAVKGVAAVNEAIKAQLDSSSTESKAIATKIETAQDTVAQKTLAWEKAKIELAAAPADKKAEKQLAVDLALKELEAANAKLRRAVLGANDPSSGGHVAMTPIVYKVVMDGKGPGRLVNVPYLEFAAMLGAKAGMGEYSNPAPQVKVASSKKIEAAPKDPPAPFLAISSDLVERKDNQLSQAPIKFTSDTELSSVTIASLTFRAPGAADSSASEHLPSVYLTDRKTGMIRFQPDTPAGDYLLELGITPVDGASAPTTSFAFRVQ
ncbi:hypothetical protein [Luteolibacter sp. Populi]|uniref:hypothetical protein n=1 Tax=Luteolibacter sp. Populi TaxID=3230487 RepID=UPI003466FE48